MYPYNLMYVVTHGGGMWTASCNAWKAVRALARWLIITKAQEIVKSNKDIKWKSRCSTAKNSLSPVILSHTMWVWSCSPSMLPGTTNVPLTAAGLWGGWGLIMKVTVQDQGSTRWQISPASAVQENKKKKTFFDEIVEAVGIYWTSVTLSMQLAQFAVASNSDIVQAVLLISAWTLKTLSHYQLCALFQLEEPW